MYGCVLTEQLINKNLRPITLFKNTGHDLIKVL